MKARIASLPPWREITSLPASADSSIATPIEIQRVLSRLRRANPSSLRWFLMEAATTTTRPQPRESTLVHFEIPTNEPDNIASFYEQLFSCKIAKVPMGPMDYWLICHKDAEEH